MGTRFCATQEAPIHDNIKQFLVSNGECDTNLIFRGFNNTGRVARNSVSDMVAEIGSRPGAEFKDVQPYVSGGKGLKALTHGVLDAGLI